MSGAEKDGMTIMPIACSATRSSSVIMQVWHKYSNMPRKTSTSPHSNMHKTTIKQS